MEPSKEPISVRIRRLSQQILGKTTIKEEMNVITREGLLDALQVLYDECNADCLKNFDKNIAVFVEKYRKILWELKQLRVNLSDFEVKSVIGRGHFGEVHVVKERQTGDFYALKTVKKSVCLEPKSAFEEERNIMAMAHSPWLTTLQYAFQDINNLYFVMEYHPGGDLLGLLYRQGGTLPESAATFYIAELVLAINDLHSMGYVHRDIKPDNILLDRCGHLKLADFGSAAHLDSNGTLVDCNLPVGTPEYIAPEVLQCMDKKKEKNASYGIACDYWSVGVLAYEITVGNTPFNAQNTSATYSKIMCHSNNIKFPTDIILSQAYISLVKGLLTDQTSRYDYNKIINHPLFKNMDLNGIRDQVPPFVPNIASVDDVSNFSDIQPKRSVPDIENFKTKTKFSGRNLPFIGFTFTPQLHDKRENYITNLTVNDSVVQKLKSELEALQRKLLRTEEASKEHEVLDRKLEEKSRKLESLEALRDKLERDLASSISETSALKRTLQIERKERAELESKALELIKAAKHKWETVEKTKTDALNAELAEQKQMNSQLSTENAILKDKLNVAKQLEHVHKNSLQKVEKLNRRSVVGLESRLQKITDESQMELSMLETTLVKEKQENNSLQKKLSDLQKQNNEAMEKLKVFEEKYGKIKAELQQTFNAKIEYQNKCTLLQNEKEKYRSEIKDVKNKLNFAADQKNEMFGLQEKLKSKEKEITSLDKYVKKLEKEINAIKSSNLLSNKEKESQSEQKIRQLEEKIELISREKLELEVKLKEADLRDTDNKVKVKGLEELLTRLESGVTKLEQGSDRESVLQEQIERLEHQLAELHESSAVEKHELGQLKSKFWRLEKDLSNANLDKRIVERDLKDSQSENKKLQMQIDSLNMKIKDSKKVHEAALLELGNLNEELANEIIKLKEVVRNLESKFDFENEKCNIEKKNVIELSNIILIKEEKIKSLEKTIKNLEFEKFNMNGKLVESRDENVKYIAEIANLNQQVFALNSELQTAKRDLENTQLNLNALREACTMLESQLVEYEKIHESFESQQEKHKQKIADMLVELTKQKVEIQAAKQSTNEEKSLRLIADTKCKKLTEDLEGYQKGINAFKQQCNDFKEYSNNLSSELSVVEEKVNDYEASIRSYERQIESYVAENTMLKEENSAQLTVLNNIKETNYKLNQSLSEARSNNMVLVDQIAELQNSFDEKINYYKEREIKLNATIQQQTKLIDYLQSKIDDGKKKKTLSDKLFGSSKKENVPPISIVLNYRDLEAELVKEKEVNKDLRHEIVKLKTESMGKGYNRVDLKEQKSVLNQIVQSPAKSDLYRQNSVQRMHHNIPHKFESRHCTKVVKCAQCGNNVLLGRCISTCKECLISVHPACISEVPRTCGLPQAFVKHYKESLSKLEKANEEEQKVSSEDKVVNVEGWVKIPIRGNTGWEKHYACLTSTHIKIYKDKPTHPNMSPIENFELFPKDTNGRVIFEPTASEICVPVANSDIPFIMKVEVSPSTTCWPPKYIVLMTLSVEDKEKWAKALGSLYKNDLKYSGDIIITFDNDKEINSVVELPNNSKLLATDEGLYSHKSEHLLYINGLSKVQHIGLLPAIHTAIMVAEKNGILITCDLNHLISLTECAPVTKPTLKYKPINVNNLDGFLILQVSDFARTNMICTATSKQILLFSYDLNQQEFVLIRKLDTAEPTSCVLFTEQSLIIGANKFYEVDLSNFEYDEFLDASDKKLSHALKCYRMKSFPLGIFQVNTDPTEYLVCFYEFASFVDEFGRSSRNSDIKWNTIPLAFHYQKPYFYIVHPTNIEVIRIDPETFNSQDDTPITFTLEFDNPQFLGSGKKGLYVKQGKCVKIFNAKNLDSDRLSFISESTDIGISEINQEDSDQFSFTSSMMQSLDGNLSDDETDNSDRPKRVKFAAVTDL